jgi:hypothetical protein
MWTYFILFLIIIEVANLDANSFVFSLVMIVVANLDMS